MERFVILLSLGLTITYVHNIAVSDPKKIWSRRVIPYVINENVYNKSAIIASINYFNTLTCVQWIERTAEDHGLPYVIFSPGAVCRSEVGKMETADKGQEIFIGRHCCIQPIILHEMYHVMGFYHEMKRFDRDAFIEIHWENIERGYEKYFDKLPSENVLITDSYDINSVMHYGSYAYSRDQLKKTITVVENKDYIIPEFNSLSLKDIEKVKQLYSCSDTTDGWSTWSAYGFCNDDCLKSRFRFCYYFSTENNNNNNNGDILCSNTVEENVNPFQIDQQECTPEECNRDGWWSRWSDWNQCNAQCGVGKQTRRRSCNSPPKRFDGLECEGEDRQTKECRRGQCVLGKYDCQFDNNGLCNWVIKNGWQRLRAGDSVGPDTDVSYLNGNYMILQGKYGMGTMSLNFEERNYKCMSFYVNSYNGKLSMRITDFSQNLYTWDVITEQAGNWTIVKVPANGFAKVELQGNVNAGYVAVDDVFFSTTKCWNVNVQRRATTTATETRTITTTKTKITITTTTTPTTETFLPTNTTTTTFETQQKDTTQKTFTPFSTKKLLSRSSTQHLTTNRNKLIPTAAKYYSSYNSKLFITIMNTYVITFCSILVMVVNSRFES